MSGAATVDSNDTALARREIRLRALGVLTDTKGKRRKHMNTSRSINAALAAGRAVLTGTAACAQVYNGMIHGYVPQQGYEQPHMMRTAVVINLGWHGDRY